MLRRSVLGLDDMLLHKTSSVKDIANVHTKLFAIDYNSFNIVFNHVFYRLYCNVVVYIYIYIYIMRAPG